MHQTIFERLPLQLYDCILNRIYIFQLNLPLSISMLKLTITYHFIVSITILSIRIGKFSDLSIFPAILPKQYTYLTPK